MIFKEKLVSLGLGFSIFLLLYVVINPKNIWEYLILTFFSTSVSYFLIFILVSEGDKNPLLFSFFYFISDWVIHTICMYLLLPVFKSQFFLILAYLIAKSISTIIVFATKKLGSRIEGLRVLIFILLGFLIGGIYYEVLINL